MRRFDFQKLIHEARPTKSEFLRFDVIVTLYCRQKTLTTNEKKPRGPIISAIAFRLLYSLQGKMVKIESQNVIDSLLTAKGEIKTNNYLEKAACLNSLAQQKLFYAYFSNKFLYKNLFFFIIFFSFNPYHAYWYQRRIFSGNLPGMFFYWRAVLFKDLFAHFHDFYCQIGVVILVTPKQEVERKRESFCGVNFFTIILRQCEKVLFEKIAFLLVFITCDDLTSKNLFTKLASLRVNFYVLMLL